MLNIQNLVLFDYRFFRTENYHFILYTDQKRKKKYVELIL